LPSARSASPCPLIRLEHGGRLGTKADERGELFGAPIIIAVGIAVASGILCTSR
jgi:hypothetical protein